MYSWPTTSQAEVRKLQRQEADIMDMLDVLLGEGCSHSLFIL